jgi:2-dehydro-3-deoxyphosphogluconate aldolase/(4S)-4-hydroxy-2-oxoglutarate aldolase
MVSDMREKIISTIEKEKLITIVRGVEKEKLIPLAEAMYTGGIRLLEVTYSANGKVSDEETAECIKILSEHFDGRMYIGAGTVLSEKQVELTKNAGGKFIISPDTNEKVIKKTRELNMVSMPGALTPSEAQKAHITGADFVKLFPVSNLGADYVKAVKAPLSHIKFLAVGGITLDNMKDYLKAGVCGFGIGSNIVDKKLVDANDFDGVTKLAEKYVNVVR